MPIQGGERATTVADQRSSSGIAARDDRSYRSFLTFDARADAVDLALQQIGSWLRQKNYEVDLTESGFVRVNDRVEVRVTHHVSKHTHAFRVRLEETEARGEAQWLTSIAMNAPEKGRGWLSVRVNHTGGKTAATPKVARYLMGVLELHDADYQFVPGAPVIRTDGVEDLFQAVCDPDRNGLLFVATTDNSDAGMFAPFAAKVERWTRGVHGMAQVVVLDPAASVAFNELMGEWHAAPPWALRTYSTELDPAWQPDARRHRILGTQRLANEPDPVIARIIERATRKHSADRQLPPDARAVIKVLNRVEDRVLLDALFRIDPDVGPSATAVPSRSETAAGTMAAPVDDEITDSDEGSTVTSVTDADESRVEIAAQLASDRDDLAEVPPTPEAADRGLAGDEADSKPARELVSGEAAEYLAMIEMVKQTLGLEVLTPEALEGVMEQAGSPAPSGTTQATADRVSRELKERQARIDALEDQLAEAQTFADDAMVEQRIADDARLKAEETVRWLRGVLNEQGRHDVAYADIPEGAATAYPESFADLVERLGALESLGVVFTGDPRITVGLDEQDTFGNIVQAAWEILLLLSDYVKAKKEGAHEGGMKQYILNTPAGYRAILRKSSVRKKPPPRSTGGRGTARFQFRPALPRTVAFSWRRTSSCLIVGL